MRANPRDDWRIEDILHAAERVGLEARRPAGGSHYVSGSPFLSRNLAVPYHRPTSTYMSGVSSSSSWRTTLRPTPEGPMRDYPMLLLPLTEEDGGGWLALLPDLPGCMSDGATCAEAAGNAQDAVAAWLEVQAERGDLAPAPGSALTPLLFHGLAGRTDEEARFLRSLLPAATSEHESEAPLLPRAAGSR